MKPSTNVYAESVMPVLCLAASTGLSWCFAAVRQRSSATAAAASIASLPLRQQQQDTQLAWRISTFLLWQDTCQLLQRHVLRCHMPIGLCVLPAAQQAQHKVAGQALAAVQQWLLYSGSSGHELHGVWNS